MALTTTFPASPQGDLYLTHFPSQTGEAETSLFLHRTLPPEWFPPRGAQLTWPHAGTDWAYMLPEVTQCYLRLAYEIAIREPLLIVAPDVAAVRALIDAKLPQRATELIIYHACPTNDTWARDHAFLTVVSNDGPELLDFRFNGWGGKFEATLDNAINASLRSVLKGRYVDCLDFELEGGSIETDGQGTLLTTSECLLNANRHAALGKEHVEALLCERLGVQRVLWLDHGYLAGDDTDSHIDTLARLAPDNTIIYVGCDDPADEHFAELRAMRSDLRAMRSASGEPFNLVELPLPDAIYDDEGNRLPATYANFLIVNNGVLVPVYNQPKKDRLACQIIRVAFPGHEIVPVDCRALIQQHGSLRWATMQFPVINL